MGGKEMLDYEALAEGVKSLVRCSMCAEAEKKCGGLFGMRDEWQCGRSRYKNDLCDKVPRAKKSQCIVAIRELVEEVDESFAIEILQKMEDLGWVKTRGRESSCDAVFFPE